MWRPFGAAVVLRWKSRMAGEAAVVHVPIYGEMAVDVVPDEMMMQESWLVKLCGELEGQLVVMCANVDGVGRRRYIKAY